MTGNVADHPLPEQSAHKTLLTRRNFLRGSALTAAGLAIYSSEIARHEISILTPTISIRNLPGAFVNFRIVQISDIHFDEYTEAAFVRRVVAHVNSLQPDLVLLTGDFISDNPLPRSFARGALHRCAEVLHGIACPQRFAIMGNHENFLGDQFVRAVLASAGIPMLVNQHIPIERAGQRLWLCGVDDPVSRFPNLNLAIPERPDGPVLLMSHGPDYADQVVAHPRGPLVDLMFAGHSHGGQVRLPIVGALCHSDGGKKYVEGLFHLDRMQLYVNRGIGTVGVPFRLNCPPEITLFTLHNA